MIENEIQKARQYLESKKGKEKIARFVNDTRYMQDHREELLHAYQDKWIAVWEGEVIASAKTLKGILRKIPKERRAAILEFMDSNPKPLILTVKGPTTVGPFNFDKINGCLYVVYVIILLIIYRIWKNY